MLLVLSATESQGDYQNAQSYYKQEDDSNSDLITCRLFIQDLITSFQAARQKCWAGLMSWAEFVSMCTIIYSGVLFIT